MAIISYRQATCLKWQVLLPLFSRLASRDTFQVSVLATTQYQQSPTRKNVLKRSSKWGKLTRCTPPLACFFRVALGAAITLFPELVQNKTQACYEALSHGHQKGSVG
jgi:hypothetical protein